MNTALAQQSNSPQSLLRHPLARITALVTIVLITAQTFGTRGFQNHGI